MDSSVLINRIPRQTYEESGLAADFLTKMEVDSLLAEEVLACLDSPDETDRAVALRFAECLGPRADFAKLAGPKLGSIVARVRKILADSEGALKANALTAFVSLRAYYPDYAEEMVSLFHSPDLSVRYEALMKVGTFISGKNFRALLAFREDQNIGYGGPWGQDLVYIFRDFALKQAETLVARSFESGRCSEVRDGKRVWWRSWRQFETWLERLNWRLSDL